MLTELEEHALVCFSATASFASGAAIGAVGLATLPLVPERRQLPFAALPLVFCAHQLLEGVIWEEVDASASASVRTPATEAWLLIALLVLPVLIPIAARLMEPDEHRRRWMAAAAVLGVGVGGYLAFRSIASPSASAASAVGHHLVYGFAVSPAWFFGILYVAATCGPLLVSSHRFVVAFGVAILISLGITVAVAAEALTSVWCFFAALLSGSLFIHYTRLRLGASRFAVSPLGSSRGMARSDRGSS